MSPLGLVRGSGGAVPPAACQRALCTYSSSNMFHTPLSHPQASPVESMHAGIAGSVCVFNLPPHPPSAPKPTGRVCVNAGVDLLIADWLSCPLVEPSLIGWRGGGAEQIGYFQVTFRERASHTCAVRLLSLRSSVHIVDVRSAPSDRKTNAQQKRRT